MMQMGGFPMAFMGQQPAFMMPGAAGQQPFAMPAAMMMGHPGLLGFPFMAAPHAAAAAAAAAAAPGGAAKAGGGEAGAGPAAAAAAAAASMAAGGGGAPMGGMMMMAAPGMPGAFMVPAGAMPMQGMPMQVGRGAGRGGVLCLARGAWEGAAC